MASQVIGVNINRQVVNRFRLVEHKPGEILALDTLRFLRFPPTALIGRHQALSQELKLDYCAKNNIRTVRRITGGQALAEMLKLHEAGPMFGMGGFQLLPFYGTLHVMTQARPEQEEVATAHALVRAARRPIH